MDYVLALHSHLPWVLHHGKWPHGSDWLTEAAVDTYLPLIGTLRGLRQDGIASPLTIGFTPVLANQLSHPSFHADLEAFLAQRLEACDEASRVFASGYDGHLAPLVNWWRDRLNRLRNLYRSLDGGIIGAFRELEYSGQIEIIGGAATHGFLPLLATDASIRLQLNLGRGEHWRLFGRAPSGCWLPECAYRPKGWWAPLPEAPANMRNGIEEFLGRAGFNYFFADGHMPLHGETPYKSYRVASPNAHANVDVLLRDPVASAQVWSREGGYPGDGRYLEFHKMRYPGGLKLWRVTGNRIDLGDKQPYHHDAALSATYEQANHFMGLLHRIAHDHQADSVVVTPFDTELYGHWWFEGPDFINQLYRAFARAHGLRPTSASQHLGSYYRGVVQLRAGSWGAGGDWRVWLSDQTAWTWKRLWPIEMDFWRVAGPALASEGTRTILEQAARELLLAQASDWQFIITGGDAADYAQKRFTHHCDDAARLIAAIQSGNIEQGLNQAAEMKTRDDLFPNIIPHIQGALQ